MTPSPLKPAHDAAPPAAWMLALLTAAVPVSAQGEPLPSDTSDRWAVRASGSQRCDLSGCAPALRDAMVPQALQDAAADGPAAPPLPSWAPMLRGQVFRLQLADDSTVALRLRGGRLALQYHQRW